MSGGEDRQARLITLVSFVMSVLLGVLLGAAFVAYTSQLALALAADSAIDVLTAAAIAWSLRISERPADESHPFGHEHAQSVTAFAVAVLAAVLSVEVLISALRSLFGSNQPVLSPALLGAFVLKGFGRLALFVWAGRILRKQKSSAVSALRVDARNDAVLSGLAVLGFVGGSFGLKQLDAWLAIPASVWIGASAYGLARETLRSLMGEAPPRERQEALAARARGVPGVEATRDIKARFHGTNIDVWLAIVVDEDLSIRQGHDIGVQVERALLQEPDVVRAVVHVDASDSGR